jgi:hypothetical protein
MNMIMRTGTIRTGVMTTVGINQVFSWSGSSSDSKSLFYGFNSFSWREFWSRSRLFLGWPLTESSFLFGSHPLSCCWSGGKIKNVT